MRISLLFLLLLSCAIAQTQPKAKLERAQREFAVGEYGAAVRTLSAAGKLDEEAKLLLAVSHFHNNDLLRAEEELVEISEAKGDPLAWFYLGRVYHAQHRFERAGVEYKRYLRSLGGSDGPERLTVVALLRNVDNGIRAGYLSEEIIAENMGNELNTENDEYGPIPSPNNSGRIYFSVVRPQPGQQRQQSDIVISNSNATGWGPALTLNPLLNTNQHETLTDISPDGQKLYYYRGSTETDGSYFVDTFNQFVTDQLVTLALDVPVSARAGDATPFFGAPDGIYFASSRPGGYGGLDLYRIPYVAGGFGPVTNLGPNVNGPYDEITPFMARDGRTLYFSTNDPTYSVGGFDVVKTYRVDNTESNFVLPTNAGMPLNSAGDDTHFRLAGDTFTGFLASDRKDGYGKNDLYIVYFVEAREEMRR